MIKEKLTVPGELVRAVVELLDEHQKERTQPVMSGKVLWELLYLSRKQGCTELRRLINAKIDQGQTSFCED